MSTYMFPCAALIMVEEMTLRIVQHDHGRVDWDTRDRSHGLLPG